MQNKFHFSYLFVLPLFCLLMGMSVFAMGSCGYIMMLFYSAKSKNIFWLIVVAVIVVIFWSIALQCISVWFPKKNKRNQVQNAVQTQNKKPQVQPAKATRQSVRESASQREEQSKMVRPCQVRPARQPQPVRNNRPLRSQSQIRARHR